MNVIYNSEHFWILAYPAQQGFELFDKDGMRTLFVQGVLARHFFHAMEDIPEAERDYATIDAFLDDYCKDSARPIVIH
ncbi:MAG: DUF3567 domain-containing protein [Betaproteobacteria bacterium]|nr:DUF3567 domain-containing protein [Betaproteobacteria bacterium]MCL2885642.1 DUF3567 domain-containing protein [Betaproteobacteria bacterium]